MCQLLETCSDRILWWGQLCRIHHICRRIGAKSENIISKHLFIKPLHIRFASKSQQILLMFIRDHYRIMGIRDIKMFQKIITLFRKFALATGDQICNKDAHVDKNSPIFLTPRFYFLCKNLMMYILSCIYDMPLNMHTVMLCFALLWLRCQFLLIWYASLAQRFQLELGKS